MLFDHLNAACRFADLAIVAANTSLFKNYTQPCAVDTYADIKVQSSVASLHACKPSKVIAPAGGCEGYLPCGLQAPAPIYLLLM